MRHGIGITILFALVAVLLCGGDAAFADGLLPEQPLSAGDSISQTLAMAPNGYAAIAWIDWPAQTLSYATRPPGGPWSAPAPLGTSGQIQESPTIAVDARGGLAVAWVESVSQTQTAVQLVTRPAGGAFTRQEALTDSNLTYEPQLGIDGAGRVTVLYATNPGLVVRELPLGGSALTARPDTLSTDTCSTGRPGLAVAATGDAVAGASCRGALFALRRGGRWTVTPPTPNTGSAFCSGTTTDPEGVAIDAQGEAVGLMLRTVATPSLADPSCMFIDGGRTMSEQLAVPEGDAMSVEPGAVASGRSPPDLIPYSPVHFGKVGIGAGGIVTAWNAYDGRDATTRARFFTPEGFPLGPAQTLDAAVGQPQLAVGEDGRALIAGVRGAGNTGTLVAATRPPGGAFSTAVDVAAGVGNFFDVAAVALDAGGDGAIAYVQGAGSTPPLHVRGFDAAPPTFDDVRIPAGADATPGAPLAFAASASDVWGPVSLAWSFGDGTGASGGAATHAYRAAGAYTATVTATDAAGNTASRSGVVHVGGGIGGGGGERAVGAPVLSRVSLSHRAFRVGRARTAVSARRRRGRAPPIGTTFRFTLDAAAGVRIAFTRSAPGRRSGRRCVRSSRRLARARRCTRLVAAGALTRGERAGADAVAFSGRVRRRALAPGSYRATLTASAGGRAGVPRALGFRVVR